MTEAGALSCSKLRRGRRHRCIQRLWQKSRWTFLANEDTILAETAFEEKLREAIDGATEQLAQKFVAREETLIERVCTEVAEAAQRKISALEAQLSESLDTLRGFVIDANDQAVTEKLPAIGEGDEEEGEEEERRSSSGGGDKGNEIGRFLAREERWRMRMVSSMFRDMYACFTEFDCGWCRLCRLRRIQRWFSDMCP